MSRGEMEALVRAVTDLVMARLDAGDRVVPAAGSRRVLLLEPVASGNAAARSEQLARIRRAGGRVDALSAGPEGENPDMAAIAAALTTLGPRDVVVVGSLGFAFGARLVALDDDDPAVRLVTQALLRGNKVVALEDDLRTGGRGPLADRAAELLRDLTALGVEPIPCAELAAAVARLAAMDTTLTQAVAELVTEADVEALAAAGETTLRLPARTIVTPLAQSRARELGLALEREES